MIFILMPNMPYITSTSEWLIIIIMSRHGISYNRCRPDAYNKIGLHAKYKILHNIANSLLNVTIMF